MPEVKKPEEATMNRKIEVTQCPDCGTEWETVVTLSRKVRRSEATRQW